jgi:hypothetical protein
MNRLLSAILVALLGSFLSTPARATDASCQPVFDAGSKVLTVPTHVYTTMTADFLRGKPRISESIYANGAIYVNVGDRWTRSKMTPQDMLKQEQENRQNTKGTCSYVRDESVNGEVAALYAEHTGSEDAKTNAQTWISKSRGVPLRTEIDMDVGAAWAKATCRFVMTTPMCIRRQACNDDSGKIQVHSRGQRG